MDIKKLFFRLAILGLWTLVVLVSYEVWRLYGIRMIGTLIIMNLIQTVAMIYCLLSSFEVQNNEFEKE